jgi:hypothetical protein
MPRVATQPPANTPIIFLTWINNSKNTRQRTRRIHRYIALQKKLAEEQAQQQQQPLPLEEQTATQREQVDDGRSQAASEIQQEHAQLELLQREERKDDTQRSCNNKATRRRATPITVNNILLETSDLTESDTDSGDDRIATTPCEPSDEARTSTTSTSTSTEATSTSTPPTPTDSSNTIKRITRKRPKPDPATRPRAKKLSSICNLRSIRSVHRGILALEQQPERAPEVEQELQQITKQQHERVVEQMQRAQQRKRKVDEQRRLAQPASKRHRPEDALQHSWRLPPVAPTLPPRIAMPTNQATQPSKLSLAAPKQATQSIEQPTTSDDTRPLMTSMRPTPVFPSEQTLVFEPVVSSKPKPKPKPKAPVAVPAIAATNMASTKRQSHKRWVINMPSPAGIAKVTTYVAQPTATTTTTTTTTTTATSMPMPPSPIIAPPSPESPDSTTLSSSSMLALEHSASPTQTPSLMHATTATTPSSSTATATMAIEQHGGSDGRSAITPIHHPAPPQPTIVIVDATSTVTQQGPPITFTRSSTT